MKLWEWIKRCCGLGYEGEVYAIDLPHHQPPYPPLPDDALRSVVPSQQDGLPPITTTGELPIPNGVGYFTRM
jgi:hypothetical protein